MDITILPKKLNGKVNAIPSKSQAHRLLICAAFADNITDIICRETNRDIEATAGCLNALGAKIQRTDFGYRVEPVCKIPAQAVLNCGESGSTLRFMLPIVGALGVEGTFVMEGRLPYRPLFPLDEEMERMGCRITRPTDATLLCTGKLRNGDYSIDGSVSSQFISGLLFAMALINGQSQLTVTGKMESRPYIKMTQLALSQFGVSTEDFIVSGSAPLRTPGKLIVEGDWSNGAFFFAAKALGSDVIVENLKPNSPQGDRAIADLIPALSQYITIPAEDIPDLVPILSVIAAANQGAEFTNIARLRIKESDRVESVIRMLKSFGIEATATEHTLIVKNGTFSSATIDAMNDHRIAMAAAIGATIATGPVTILGAQCVEKSYPAFWQVYQSLGGSYEQHIR